MYRSTASSLSTGDRWVVGMMAACITFIVGYTITRAGLAQPAGSISEDVQLSVTPHEGELWKGFGE